MGRSLKKGPFVDEHLMKKVEAQANDEKSFFKTTSHFVVFSFKLNVPQRLALRSATELADVMC